MPEQVAISDFVTQSWDDCKSPTTSTFHKSMSKYKESVASIEDELDADRSELNKLKKSVRALYNTTSKHAQNEKDIAENLEKIGRSSSDSRNEIKQAFHEFSKVTKVLATLMEDLAKSLHNSFQFPLESILKGDIKGVKGDLRKPFDKATKDYETKLAKLEKEAKKRAEGQGFLYRSELTGSDVAVDMENERKMFQLRMCRYLIKVSDIRTKKGVDLLNYLSDYYKSVQMFFEKGKAEVEKYLTFVDEYSKHLKEIKQAQKQEQTKLQELETQLQSSMTNIKEPVNSTTSTPGYSLHQIQGNKNHGSTKEGNLLKKSEKLLRNMWQKRKCRIKDGIMFVSHSDVTKKATELNLLTCQVKLVSEDPGKKCFDVVSSEENRTYHFQADDEKDMEQWISVLSNAKEKVLLTAFHNTGSTSTMNDGIKKLIQKIIEGVEGLPGNKECCDCGAKDPKWLSTNLGVLICLECCGIHRNLGVHVSRTQSIEIDQLGTSQLLLARVIGNDSFNEILEARLRDRNLKPKPSSPMQDREDFIKAKYIQHRFTIQMCTDTTELHQELQQAIQTGDIQALLQVYAEGVDLMSVLPNSLKGETGLHLAIQLEDGTTLHIVDFIVQNSNANSLSRQTRDGNTCLHLCAMLNKSECMKCILRTKPDIAHVKNAAGLTALDIAIEKDNTLCADLLNAAMEGKKDVFEHINIEWDLMIQDDGPADSEDEIEPKERRSRPSSVVGLGSEFTPREGSPIDKVEDNMPRLKPRKHHLTHPTRFRNSLRNIADEDNARSSKYKVPNLTNHSSQPISSFNLPSSGQKSPENPPLPPRNKKALPSGPPPSVPEAMGGDGALRKSADIDTNIPYILHRRTPSEPPPRPAHSLMDRNTIHGSQLPGFGSHPNLDPSKPAVPPKPRPMSENENKSETAPVPPQRKPKKAGYRRCEALYDCDADNEDELTFREGEIILLLREEEQDWWEGEIENQPHRRGLFPMTFVKPLPD